MGMFKKVISLLAVLTLMFSPLAFASTRVTIVNGQGEEISNNGGQLAVSGTGEIGSAPTDDTVNKPLMPVVGGAVAETTVPTAVDDGDVVLPSYNEYGEQRLAGYNPATGAVDVNPVAQAPVHSGSQLILSVLFDADPDDDDPQTSDVVFIGGMRKVALLIETDITQDAETIEVDYTFEVSPDNSTWIDAYFNADDAGEADTTINHQSGSTATISSTSYLPDGFTAQYVRVIATCTDTDANDTAAVSVYLNYQI